jgi:hypothetical protein
MIMTKLEVDLLNAESNAAVIRIPGRQYPGILIQGDSLAILSEMATRAVAALSNGENAEVREELEELASLLRGYQVSYERALAQEGIQLPYRQQD